MKYLEGLLVNGFQKEKKRDSTDYTQLVFETKSGNVRSFSV